MQGVFFRTNTEQIAQTFGLQGFVRNEPDGSIFIEAEGEEGALQKLVSWCQHGPRAAKVDRVEVHEGPMKEYIGFEIRYSSP